MQYQELVPLCSYLRWAAEIPTTKEGLIHTGRDARLYIGEGAIDIASIVNRMPKMVYSIENCLILKGLKNLDMQSTLAVVYSLQRLFRQISKE